MRTNNLLNHAGSGYRYTMNTRAKLVCVKVEETDNGHTSNPEKTGENVTFETRYNAEDSPEDNSYSKYTPFANAYLSITNPDLFGTFVEGDAYYFDISKA